MSKPAWLRSLRLPLIAAPMFLVSSPETVLASCRAGIVGTFPALNARTEDQLDEWLARITDGLAQAEEDHAKNPRLPKPAPFGINLIVHKMNPRMEANLEKAKKYRAPLVITSLGAVPSVVKEVHNWGGSVFHDVTNAVHAKKAVSAGVDGLILVTAGAGGHAGVASPFALVPKIRSFFPGTIALAGAMGSGSSILAAQALGADVGYMGTRFLATKESLASEAYKDMIVRADAGPPPTFLPVAYTDRVSGIPANFLRESLAEHRIPNPDAKVPAGQTAAPHAGGEDWLTDANSKAWKDIWSAGQGVMNIDDIPSVGDLVDRMEKEYKEAKKAIV